MGVFSSMYKRASGLGLLLATAAGLGACTKKGAGDSAKANIYFRNLGAEPSTLNPITSSDLYASNVQAYVIETLLNRNDDTYEWEPSLATSWEISKDKKQFTFKLRPGVKWHDGKPLTVEDVKFSFDVIFDPNYDTAHLRPYYESIEKAEVVDPQTIRFTAKNMYWGNFDQVATLNVIPKHIYEGKKAEGALNKTLIGTGPYILDKYDQGNRIVLKKNTDWWGNTAPEYKGQYNFPQIVLRFVKEENVALEMLKKGDLDYEDFRPEVYVNKAEGPEWGKSVAKVKTQNSAPKSYGFIGWNMKNDLFKDRDVRVALAHLFNRKLVIEKFLYDMAVPASGPIHVTSPYANTAVKPIEYDPKKGLELLKKVGWDDKDKNGVLEKTINGKKTEFRFTLMTANADTMKYYTVFKEDAKQVGVDIEIKLLEWNSFVKLLDEQKFDAVTLAWGGGAVDPEPKQIWHSSSAVAGGSNFISYKNPKVDQLIDEMRGIFDREERIKKFQQIFALIAEDAPYLFLFNQMYALYGHSTRLDRPKDTFKYTIGTNHWSIKAN